jgi:hypothetical protein
MTRSRLTTEEKVAQKLSDLLADIRIDISYVGMYFSMIAPVEIQRRFLVVADDVKRAMDEGEH